MADRGLAVAGVPSERLSQLASPQLVQRTRRENALGAGHSAFKDEMSAILRPCHPCSSNNSSRKNSARGKVAAPQGGGTRSLRQYVSADQLPQAFCTKFQVTDPLSGRTEFMTARRPGKASAEVNIANFDSYMLSKERPFSLQKGKDNIDHDILGLMPKTNTELKFSVGTIARQHQLPSLECRENWMTPTATANVYRPLGLSKRHSAFPWTPSDTNNIAHMYGGQSMASPRTTRACIRPAFISS